MNKHVLYENLPPIRRVRLNEGVVTRIKALIYSKELKVGEKLPSERDLASHLEVSRVTVREALRSLEQSGLIEIRPGITGGAFVVYNLQKPLFDCVYDLFRGGSLTLSHFTEARRTIECFAIRQAVDKVTERSIDRLKQINESMVEGLDRERFVAQNMAFHTTIAELSGNPLISLMVQALFDLLKRLRPDFVQRDKFIKGTFKRHEAIIEALRRKDAALCEELMAADVEHTRKLRNLEQE
jgi:GntR family transcriptional regulator, transcriptional repressor for pyruvate dehydrogenase complex